jgi:hypothetical protein
MPRFPPNFLAIFTKPASKAFDVDSDRRVQLSDLGLEVAYLLSRQHLFDTSTCFELGSSAGESLFQRRLRHSAATTLRCGRRCEIPIDGR